MSPVNSACSAGHALTHVTLDAFVRGKAPVCNRCNLRFSFGSSVFSCYQCAQNCMLKMPIPNVMAERSLHKGFAVCHGRATSILSANCNHYRGSTRMRINPLTSLFIDLLRFGIVMQNGNLTRTYNGNFQR